MLSSLAARFPAVARLLGVEVPVPDNANAGALSLVDEGDAKRAVQLPARIGGEPQPRFGELASEIVRTAAKNSAVEFEGALVGVSYFEQVPPAQRERIQKMSEAAYGVKKPPVTFEEFREAMALCWLKQRDVFYQVGRAQGFRAVTSMARHENVAALVFTESGSVVTMTKPGIESIRKMGYVRIEIRERSPKHRPLPPVQAFSDSQLLTPLTVLDRKPSRVIAPGLANTSAVLAIMIMPNADEDHIGVTTGAIRTGFINAKHVTIGAWDEEDPK